jgi:DNA-directed RNA polymerase specialized sigma24 family protein
MCAPSAYADVMTSSVAELTAEASSRDPAEGLQAVAALRRLLERLEELHIRNARAAGWSWSEIAALLGVTKQTVHRKYKDRC